jgi:hypothetical protein
LQPSWSSPVSVDRKEDRCHDDNQSGVWRGVSCKEKLAIVGSAAQHGGRSNGGGSKEGCDYLKKNDITQLLCSSGVIVSISY